MLKRSLYLMLAILLLTGCSEKKRTYKSYYVYLINENFVAEANRAPGEYVTVNERKVSKNACFFTTEPFQGDYVGFDKGDFDKGFIIPASKYHLLRATEYDSIRKGLISTHTVYSGNLSRIETGDIVPTVVTDKFGNVVKPGGYLLPVDNRPQLNLLLWVLIPVAVLLLMFAFSRKSKPGDGVSPVIPLITTIAMLSELLIVYWVLDGKEDGYFNLIEHIQVVIPAVAIAFINSLVALEVTVAMFHNYSVKLTWKNYLLAFGISVFAGLMMSAFCKLLLGWDNTDVRLGIANLIALLAGFFGWVGYCMRCQNPASLILMPFVIFIPAFGIFNALLVLMVWVGWWLTKDLVPDFFGSGSESPSENTIKNGAGGTCASCRLLGTGMCSHGLKVDLNSPICDDWQPVRR